MKTPVITQEERPLLLDNKSILGAIFIACWYLLKKRQQINKAILKFACSHNSGFTNQYLSVDEGYTAKTCKCCFKRIYKDFWF